MTCMKLLMVDDQLDMLETLKDILEQKGFYVQTAKNGEEAIEHIKKDYYDIILVDVNMPGIDGLETFRQIKNIHPTSAVIMMTGNSAEEELKKAIDEGAYAVIYKPFNVKKLIETLENLNAQSLILVVDDQDEDRETLRDIFNDKGYRTITAKDGMEAINIVGEKNFDVILLDIKMPGINGIEALERIKKINPQIGVIMMTAYAGEEVVSEVLKKGAYACLYKPMLDIEKLSQIIQDIHSKSRGKAPVHKAANILLVDDEPDYRETLGDILSDEGYQIACVSTGEEAIEEVGKRDYNIALVDYKLADTTGMELAEKLKDKKPSLSVIMMTGFSNLDSVRKNNRNILYEILVKPIQMPDLKRLIREVIEQQK